MDDDAEAVRDALKALDDAIEQRDLQAALRLCTEDVVFIGRVKVRRLSGATQSSPCSALSRLTSKA